MSPKNTLPSASSVLVPGTILRELDSFEEFFSLIEQRLSRSSVLIGEAEGVTMPEQWEEAGRTLQQSSPLLSASIRKIRGQRPTLIASDKPLRIRIKPLNQLISLEEEMQNELRKSFGDGSDLLIRITVFLGATRAVIVLASHHAAFDGTSNLIIMRELLNAVAGQGAPSKFPLSAGLSVLTNSPSPAPYLMDLASDISETQGAEFAHESSQISVSLLSLDRDLTSELVRRSRQEMTTVHGALMAAIVLAGREFSEPWRSKPLKTFSPIDARSTLQLPESLGVTFTLHPMVINPVEQKSLWEMAREVKQSLLGSQTREAAAQFALGVSSLFVNEETPQSVYKKALVEPLAHELMLTNYGAYKMKTDYGSLRLMTLYSGGGNGSPTTQKISVLTVDGQLRMALVSQQPFPSLLEDTRAILERTLR